MDDETIATAMGAGQPRYIADEGLETAARVALTLGQPLLLTGEPGTGKTSFASYLASTIAPAFFATQEASNPGPFSLHRFETKSTSISSDLFYRFDSLRRFQAANTPGMNADMRDYITFEALGQAILESLPRADVADLLRPDQVHPGPRRSVVLIDEVDKAPRDFPNDLLNEIDGRFFRIPEWVDASQRGVRTVWANKDLRPIIVLTSNSEKNLPAPFLRRCVFHHIRFPTHAEKSKLMRIIASQVSGRTGRLADTASDFFFQVRDQLHLDKLPTTHELLQWIQVLHTPNWFGSLNNIADYRLDELPLEDVKATLGIIAKTAADRDEVEALLISRFASQA